MAVNGQQHDHFHGLMPRHREPADSRSGATMSTQCFLSTETQIEAETCHRRRTARSPSPDQRLPRVRWRNRRTGREEEHAIARLFVFTGGDPVANRLAGCGIPLNDRGFIRTGAEVGSIERVLPPMETGVEGIFAVGDVHSGSEKRVGAAMGEGAAVVAQMHRFLARRESAVSSIH